MAFDVARIQLSLKGFDKMLEQLQAAGGNIDQAASRCIKESAQIVENELYTEATAKGVPSDITKEIKSSTSHSADRYEAKVGWKMGNYDPSKPSAGYKAVFLNYGTVRRTTKKGANRGKISERQFIAEAKKKAKPKVRKIQQQILKEALEDLEK